MDVHMIEREHNIINSGCMYFLTYILEVDSNPCSHKPPSEGEVGINYHRLWFEGARCLLLRIMPKGIKYVRHSILTVVFVRRSKCSTEFDNRFCSNWFAIGGRKRWNDLLREKEHSDDLGNGDFHRWERTRGHRFECRSDQVQIKYNNAVAGRKKGNGREVPFPDAFFGTITFERAGKKMCHHCLSAYSG